MRYLDYITENYNDSTVWNDQSKIDTGIPITSTNMSVRIKYNEKFDNHNIIYCARIAGYYQIVDYSDLGGGFFIGGMNGGYFGCGQYNGLNLGIAEQNVWNDITFGTTYAYDNKNNVYLYQNSRPNTPDPVGTNIYVDVNWTKVNEVIIYDGETVVFDGKAAIDDNGHIGLWDEISETLVYNPDLDMYNPEIDCTDCSNWEECGYESYEDCMCQQYGEDCPPDCTDCNNWEECGYESYDDCQCQQYGICPPEPVEHLKIVDVLRGILIEMTDDEECELASWQYNDMATSNVKLDNKKPSPTAVFYQITDFVYDLTTGIKREKANVFVAFLQKEVKLDAEGLEQDKIIKKMSEIAFEFLKNVMDEGSLRVLNDKITLKSTFLRSDSNRTGVVMELELEEKSGTCF